MKKAQVSSVQKKSSERAAINLGELDETLGFILRGAWDKARQFTQVNAGFNRAGIGSAQYAALIVVEQNPECRISDLCRTLGISQTNIVPFVDSLLTRGWVYRDFALHDRRTKRLSLTDAGREFLATMRVQHEPVTTHFKAKLGPRNYKRLVELLKLFASDEEMTEEE